MVRSILLGLLVLCSASACKGGGPDAPVVEPGAPVGKVIEITGKVTATRGSATRDLDATSTVSGDDVITTTGDGQVTILLAHNNARWALGPNKHEQVSQSMAWQLAKTDSPAAAVDETTTAAGRHAERTAATGESAAAAPRTAVSSQDRMKSADPAPPTADQAPAPGATSTTPGPTAAAEPQTPPPPPPPPPPPAPDRKPEPKPMVSPKVSPRPPAKVAVGSRGGEGTASNDGDKAQKGVKRPNNEAAPAPQDGAPLGAPDVGGGGTDPVAAALDRESAELHKCVAASGKDKLTIVVRVAKGATTITLADGTAADRACLGKIAARIKLTVETSYATTITK